MAGAPNVDVDPKVDVVGAPNDEVAGAPKEVVGAPNAGAVFAPNAVFVDPNQKSIQSNLSK